MQPALWLMCRPQNLHQFLLRLEVMAASVIRFVQRWHLEIP